jgi:hypothetical protein
MFAVLGLVALVMFVAPQNSRALLGKVVFGEE